MSLRYMCLFSVSTLKDGARPWHQEAEAGDAALDARHEFVWGGGGTKVLSFFSHGPVVLFCMNEKQGACHIAPEKSEMIFAICHLPRPF